MTQGLDSTKLKPRQSTQSWYSKTNLSQDPQHNQTNWIHKCTAYFPQLCLVFSFKSPSSLRHNTHFRARERKEERAAGMRHRHISQITGTIKAVSSPRRGRTRLLTTTRRDDGNHFLPYTIKQTLSPVWNFTTKCRMLMSWYNKYMTSVMYCKLRRDEALKERLFWSAFMEQNKMWTVKTYIHLFICSSWKHVGVSTFNICDNWMEGKAGWLCVYLWIDLAAGYKPPPPTKPFFHLHLYTHIYRKPRFIQGTRPPPLPSSSSSQRVKSCTWPRPHRPPPPSPGPTDSSQASRLQKVLRFKHTHTHMQPLLHTHITVLQCCFFLTFIYPGKVKLNFFFFQGSFSASTTAQNSSDS